MMQSLPSGYLPLSAPRGPSVRRLLATALRAASVLLARLSRQLAAAERRREGASAPGVVEFYAEAGAAEGALYVNGQLVGYLPGVSRL